MVLAVALGAESLAAAEAAHVGPLLEVGAHVDAQVVLLAEGLPAAGLLAPVGLRARVEVHVGLHAVVALEQFAAAGVGALEAQLGLGLGGSGGPLNLTRGRGTLLNSLFSGLGHFAEVGLMNAFE